jgi:hypothetical protein
MGHSKLASGQIWSAGFHLGVADNAYSVSTYVLEMQQPVIQLLKVKLD